MLCTLVDLNMEYEGIKDVNCYLIFVDLQKETSKEKLEEILTYFNSYCNVSKKIFILGLKEKEETQKHIHTKFRNTRITLKEIS